MQIAYTLSPKEVRKMTGKKLRAALAGFFAASALVAGTAISPPAHAAPGAALLDGAPTTGPTEIAVKEQASIGSEFLARQFSQLSLHIADGRM